MSSAVDNQAETRKETRDVLLAAITQEVNAIDPQEHQHNRVALLHKLAEAYSLVYHGGKTEHPAKS